MRPPSRLLVSALCESFPASASFVWLCLTPSPGRGRGAGPKRERAVGAKEEMRRQRGATQEDTTRLCDILYAVAANCKPRQPLLRKSLLSLSASALSLKATQSFFFTLHIMLNSLSNVLS